MATKMKTLTINDVTYDITDDSAVSFVEEQELTEAQKARARANIGVGAGSNIEPADDDIPKVFFGAALPQTKDDVIMSFQYISKTKDIKGYCKTKAQGSSSLAYPKKNQTVKLYKDAACVEKLKVDFKGWGEQNKFCFKANWIDLTHARNIVSARLWGDIVKSRDNYSELPESLRVSPNLGAVDGFSVKVYADGVYQGRYTINIPKDAWMANMDDELDTHCILCGESNADDRSLFRATATIDETDWSDELHDTVPDAIKTRWNETIAFIMNSTDEEFRNGIGNYFDVTSLIDYYLFGLISCGLDAFGKNQLYMTYNGQKWYATMYDMDSTWGLWWNGEYFVSTTYGRASFQDYVDGNGNLLYERVETLLSNEIKARWKNLRNGALSMASIVNRFERFVDIVPSELVGEDYADTTGDGKYTTIPSQSTNNIQQIRGFVVERWKYFDNRLLSIGTYESVTWNSNMSINGYNGIMEAKDGIYSTSQFTLPSGLYKVTFNNSGINTISVWDEMLQYVGKMQVPSTAYFAAVDGYRYVLGVSKSSGFDGNQVVVERVDNDATKGNTVSIRLADLDFYQHSWGAGIQADITNIVGWGDSVTANTALQKIHHCNIACIVNTRPTYAEHRGSSDKVIGTIIATDGAVYFYVMRFGTSIDNAVAFFEENDSMLIING